MREHTYDLKDTNEYKIYSNRFRLYLIIALIYFSVVIGSIVSLFFNVPLDYALQFTLACCAVYLPFFCILIYLPIRCYKKKKYLINKYHNYFEFEVTLPTPIKISSSRVKYLISIKSISKEVESHIYSESLITSKRMLIGYDLTTNDIIFLKNI